MLRSLSLLSLLALYSLSGALATPIGVHESARRATLPLTRRFDMAGFKNIVEADRARARALIERGLSVTHLSNSTAVGRNAKRDVSSFPVTNVGVIYTTEVLVGNPGTPYDLLIDTGSSNTWVGANKLYECPVSGTTPGVVEVTYGSGSFAGTECIDRVQLSPGLVIEKQSIGAAKVSQGFSGFDGILGIGPTDLTKGTVVDPTNPMSTVPTVTDNLFSQGTLPQALVGVSFEPTTSTSDENGELTFGGVDSSKYNGEISYTPVTQTSPASAYWGIDESITYGGDSVLASTAGIVDTGTTLVMIASDAFKHYQQLTGATPDQTTGLLSITPDQYANLQDLNFMINGNNYPLTPNAQIWPRSLNTQIGGTPGAIYLIVADIGQNSGSGLDFINGYTFLERYYSAFDTTNNQVGFAPTPHTDDETN